MQLFLTLHGHALLRAPHGRGALALQHSLGHAARMLGPPPPAADDAAPSASRRLSVASEAEFARLVQRGLLKGACTSVLTALPTHALENPNWLENLDGLLALAASFLFDDRSHVAHLGPSEAAEADPDAFLAAGGASPNAPWVSCVGAGGSWDDAPLVTPLLQLLGLLGVGVAPQPARGPRDSGGDGGGDHPRVRAAWVAHCDGAGDRARKAGKKRLSLTPRLSTAAAPAAATAHDDGGEAEAADGGGAGAADGAAADAARGELDGGAGAGAAAARSHRRRRLAGASRVGGALHTPRGLARPRAAQVRPAARAARRRLGVTVGGGGGRAAWAAASTAARRRTRLSWWRRAARGRRGRSSGGRPRSWRPRRRARCRGRGSTPSAD